MIRPFIRLFLLAPVMASVAATVPLPAQQAPSSDTAIRLTLGGAIRLASRQNASVEGAQSRLAAAKARVTQRRAEFLPNLSAAVGEHGSTINSATFPIDFPSVPGQPALFDPRGSILGPVNALDVRARVSQTLFDPAARTKVETARLGVDAASADAANVADLAASAAANAYLAVLRADAVYAAHLQDSTLAAELVGIAQDQLKAGTGIALDVTRARTRRRRRGPRPGRAPARPRSGTTTVALAAHRRARPAHRGSQRARPHPRRTGSRAWRVAGTDRARGYVGGSLHVGERRCSGGARPRIAR